MLVYPKFSQIFLTIFYAIAILISLFLKIYLKDKPRKIQMIPTNIILVIIVIMEVFKQFKNFVGFDIGSMVSILVGDTSQELDMYAFPFHFCSFFFFWPIFSLFAKGKAKTFFENLTFLWSALITAFVVFYPECVIGGALEEMGKGYAISHTIVFHLLVVLYFFISIALRLHKFNIKTIWQGCASFLIYAAIAIPCAFIFNSNYCSILYPEAFPFLVPIYNLGYFIYEPIMIIIGMILASIFYSLICFFEYLRDLVKDNSKYILYWFIFACVLPFLAYYLQALFTAEAISGFYPLLLILLGLITLLPALIPSHIRIFKERKKR